MKLRIKQTASTALDVHHRVSRVRCGAILFATLAAFGTGTQGQEANESTQLLLRPGDKVTFQWPGTHSRSCGVIGALDRGVDGMTWAWIQPVDSPLAVVHLSVVTVQSECSAGSKIVSTRSVK